MIEAIQYLCKSAHYLYSEQADRIARIYISLSQGRKVFRLFKFVPELAMVSSSDVLASLKHLCSGAFYILYHFV